MSQMDSCSHASRAHDHDASGAESADAGQRLWATQRLSNLFDLGVHRGRKYHVYCAVEPVLDPAGVRGAGTDAPLYRRVRYMSHGINVDILAQRAAVAELRRRGLGTAVAVGKRLVVWEAAGTRWKDVESLLKGFFLSESTGTWDHGADAWVTQALRASVRNEIMLELEKKGWMRMKDRMISVADVAPSAAVRVDVQVGNPENGNLIAKISVEKAWVRKLKEDETEVDVVISPGATFGYLGALRLAGTSLEMSVRQRWYECGLSQSTFQLAKPDLLDRGEVLFVHIDEGLNVPVPKERILALASSPVCSVHRKLADRLPANSMNASSATKVSEKQPEPCSRKRPRSPSPYPEKAQPAFRYLKSRELFQHIPSVPPLAFRDGSKGGPTATSLNAAIAAARKMASNTIKLSHSARKSSPVTSFFDSHSMLGSFSVSESPALQQKAKTELEMESELPSPSVLPRMEFGDDFEDVGKFFEEGQSDEGQKDVTSSTPTLSAIAQGSPMEIDVGDGALNESSLRERMSPVLPESPKRDSELRNYFEENMYKRSWPRDFSVSPHPSASTQDTILSVGKFRASSPKPEILKHTVATRRYVPQRELRKFLKARYGSALFNEISVTSSISDSDSETDLEREMVNSETGPKTQEASLSAGSGKIKEEDAVLDEAVQVGDQRDCNETKISSEGRCILQGQSPAKVAAKVAIDCASASYELLSDVFQVKELSAHVRARCQRATSTAASSDKAQDSHHPDSLLTILEMMSVSSIGRSHCDVFPLEEEESCNNAVLTSAPSSMVRRVLFSFPELLRSMILSSNFSNSIAEPPDGFARPLTLAEAYGSGSVYATPSARVCVGRSGDWLETSGRILPLWEKCSLEPFSSPKNLRYMAVAPHSCESEVEVFFKDLSVAYKELSFGHHVPFFGDSICFVSNSVPDEASVGNWYSQTSALSEHGPNEAERKLIEQYVLTGKSLVARLCAILRSGKCGQEEDIGHDADAENKNKEAWKGEVSEGGQGSIFHTVLYIVSPFPKESTKCNAALMRALSPHLLTNSLLEMLSAGSILPSAPYRNAPSLSLSNTLLNSISVRVLPMESCLPPKLRLRYQDFMTPLRPQLLKSIATGTYNAVRTHRLAPAEQLPRGSQLGRYPNELLSPLTPDITDGSAYHSRLQLLKKNSLGQSSGCVSGSTEFIGRNLVSGWKYSPAIALGEKAGPGQNGSREIGLHIAYAWSQSSNRWVYAWSDDRGEMLDVSSITGSTVRADRRKAFMTIWDRSCRWTNGRVQINRITVAKMDSLPDGEGEQGMSKEEADDWHSVVHRTLENGLKRWYYPLTKLQDVGIEHLMEATTPAEGAMDTSDLTDVCNRGSAGTGTPAHDVVYAGLSHVDSVNVVSVSQDMDIVEFLARRRVAAQKESIVTCDSTEGPKSYVSALCGGGEEEVRRGFSVTLISRYSAKEHAGRDALLSISKEYVELRALVERPCWPRHHFQGLWPLHLDCVAKLKGLLEAVLETS